ncbi:MAG: murein transglycosylase domain-containing protein [Gammaproteobacteria bacterium]|nr:murein transglycosylase domain-containing protein [Gammaproteobacteria bacterium]
MIKLFLNILLLATVSLVSGISSAESFSDYLKSQQDTTSSQFRQYSTAEKDEFETYKQQLLTAFDEYKKSVATVWGNKHNDIPTNTRDVSYQDNMNQRSIIDYETGQIKVELALSPDAAKNTALVQKQMQKAINSALNRGSDTRSIIEIAKNPSKSKPVGPALLANLVKTGGDKALSNSKRTQFITQQSKKIQKTSTRGTDKQPRVIVSTSFPMISNHMRVRAEKYLKPVKKYSAKMKLPTEIVFAIMETESAFNPNARSGVPAFGLMQLVPTSGARDAYRLLFDKDKVVTDRYLYNPDNNIKLGTAFIHKLYYSYLSGIKSAEARTWATIAAYNTGAGNVFNTFAGKYRKSKFGNRSNWKNQALSSINNKTPEQVYQYLKRNLPHKETQHYIQNIRKRIPKYKSL